MTIDLAITPGGRVGDDSPLAKPGNEGPRRLDDYVRMVAHALIKRGMGKSHAIAAARVTLAKWARGEGNVRPQVRAAAAKALAHQAELDKRRSIDMAASIEHGSNALNPRVDVRDLDLSSLDTLDGSDELDLAPGDYRPPYDWKHGYVPLTPAAVRSKRKMDGKTGRAKPPKGKRPAGSRLAKAQDDDARGRGVPGETRAAQNAVNASSSSKVTPTAAEVKRGREVGVRMGVSNPDAHSSIAQQIAEGRAKGRTSVTVEAGGKSSVLNIGEGSGLAGRATPEQVAAAKPQGKDAREMTAAEKIKAVDIMHGSTSPAAKRARERWGTGPGAATTRTTTGDQPATQSEQSGREAEGRESSTRLKVEALFRQSRTPGLSESDRAAKTKEAEKAAKAAGLDPDKVDEDVRKGMYEYRNGDFVLRGDVPDVVKREAAANHRAQAKVQRERGNADSAAYHEKEAAKYEDGDTRRAAQRTDPAKIGTIEPTRDRKARQAEADAADAQQRAIVDRLNARAGQQVRDNDAGGASSTSRSKGYRDLDGPRLVDEAAKRGLGGKEMLSGKSDSQLRTMLKDHDKNPAASHVDNARARSESRTGASPERDYPVGTRVRAGVAGNDNTVSGRVVGHTDTGMLRVKYRDRNDRDVTGTFNPSQAQNLDRVTATRMGERAKASRANAEAAGVRTPAPESQASRAAAAQGGGEDKWKKNADAAKARLAAVDNASAAELRAMAADPNVPAAQRAAARDRLSQMDHAGGQGMAGAITPAVAGKMSDTQLEDAVRRLMASGTYSGPGLQVLEAELDRRDKARAEGNARRR